MARKDKENEEEEKKDEREGRKDEREGRRRMRGRGGSRPMHKLDMQANYTNELWRWLSSLFYLIKRGANHLTTRLIIYRVFQKCIF